jgi:MoxR-like ATPases
VLIEDVPGVGKTLLAKLFSKVLGLSYRRIQFTPDLLPSDIVGTKVWRREREEFETVKGPIFTNVLLADEINRAPPKTQAALLEAMQELQVTIEGRDLPAGQTFLVLATQNPIELEGTYPLPEAQLDRFMLRISLGYPDDRRLLKERLAVALRRPLGARQGGLEQGGDPRSHVVRGGRGGRGRAVGLRGPVRLN